ncbi:MAG: SdpI family protein [Rhodococcus sp. (in: high G+C Gram-positive bacteria)]
MAVAVTMLVLSLTVFATALATKSPDQEPNSIIGIKTRATKSSKVAWVAAHRVAYPYMVGGASHCLISAVLIFVLLALDALPSTGMVIVSTALAVGGVCILALSGIKADREARRHVNQD